VYALVVLAYLAEFVFVFAFVFFALYATLVPGMAMASADKDFKKFIGFLLAVFALGCATFCVASPTPTGWPALIDQYYKAEAYDYRAKHVCPKCGKVDCGFDMHWLKTDGEYGDGVQAR